MPKLAPRLQKTVQKADTVGGSFEPLPPGKYVATVASVVAKDSAAGNPMWEVTWSDLKSPDGESKPGRQWSYLMMPLDKTKVPEGKTADKWATAQDLNAGRIKAFFEAVGYTEDTDTDEIVNDKAQALLTIAIETIQKGERAGQKTNRVTGMGPIPEDMEGDFDADDDGDDEDGF